MLLGFQRERTCLLSCIEEVQEDFWKIILCLPPLLGTTYKMNLAMHRSCRGDRCQEHLRRTVSESCFAAAISKPLCWRNLFCRSSKPFLQVHWLETGSPHHTCVPAAAAAASVQAEIGAEDGDHVTVRLYPQNEQPEQSCTYLISASNWIGPLQHTQAEWRLIYFHGRFDCNFANLNCRGNR